jgi:MBOAT membrane-bound O-acyltransferase family protein
MYLALAIVIPYLLAILCYPILARKDRLGQLALIVLCLPIALSPCLIPTGKPLPRFLAAVVAVVIIVKLFDLRYEVRRGSGPSWSTFVAFLVNPFVHVRRCLPMEPRPSVRTDLVRLAGQAVGLVAGIFLLRALFRIDWDSYPFLVEHGSKVVAFFLAVFSGLALAAALWRLLGGMARDYMANPLVASTPADFWRRYNRNMHQFFLKDVFVSAGGLRAPVRATLLVFILSALIHEYLFSIAIGRVQGYQTAFFLIQGVAVAATARIKVRGRGALLWIVATLAFNLVTSVLFFASMNELVPFYAHGLPTWLRCW